MTTLSTRIPVMRPQLPSADKLLPYLRRIDDSRYYSNHGPLIAAFEERLRTYFGGTPINVTTVSNGTMALTAALHAVGAAPGKKCLLPSWTFVASAAAVWGANLVPHFVDVSLDTWMLDPESLRQRPDLAEVGAVMVVSAFGAPVNMSEWDAFTAHTGIPVIVDAAAGFDTAAAVPAAAPGRSPMMISFHATKVFGVGEGAVVVSTDRDLIERVRQVSNFGESAAPESQLLGYNGKLSEYQAAIGLAALDAWPERRRMVDRLTDRMGSELAMVPSVRPSPEFGSGWISCYCNVTSSLHADEIGQRLAEENIETRRWWRRGVHRQAAYREFGRDSLPVTEWLADHVIGLPFSPDLSEVDIQRSISALRTLPTNN